MGNVPFQGATFDEFAAKHRTEVPALTKGSPRLRTLLHGMMAKPQAARPDLDALLRRLIGLASGTRGVGAGAAFLAEASGTLALDQARHEAAAATASTIEAERKALRRHGEQSIRDIVSALLSSIEELSPTAKIARRGAECSAQLGKGKLTISPLIWAEIQAEAFANSRWNIVCGGTIVIESPRYVRSASLWFGSIENQGARWREVSYWSFHGGDKVPCFLPPNRDADLAAGPGMHTWNLAHPPRPIDEDDVDSFCDRWMGFLAQAANGTLSRPMMLPEP